MAKTSATSHREIAARIERALDAHDRPLALVGRSGCGKTSLLRKVLGGRKVEPRWTTARDLADTIVDAIRRGAQGRILTDLGEEGRPLVVEHLEDLRAKPRTLEELRRLLEVRTHRGGAVFLTLTTRPGAEDVARWLARHAEVARPVVPRVPGRTGPASLRP
jgi:type II secretory pathway predicted ATPase ExeA